MHESWERLIRAQCEDIEALEGVGVGVSNDAVNGRVLVTIAGSRTTVKQGMDEVIKLIASHRRYREGDIRLRRFEGQSVVDRPGFEKAAPIRKEELSKCREPFDWERYASGSDTLY